MPFLFAASLIAVRRMVFNGESPAKLTAESLNEFSLCSNFDFLLPFSAIQPAFRGSVFAGMPKGNVHLLLNFLLLLSK